VSADKNKNITYDTQAPYIASYIIVQNDEGNIAFLMRQNTAWMNGFYSLPSGKVEKNESFTAAAVREAKEEIGIDVKPEDMEYVLTVHRNSSEDDNWQMKWVDVFFVVKQHTGDVQNAEPHMHSELAWLDPDDLPDNVIPSLAASLEAWRKGDMFFEYNW
jgi:8-oxo-dGTP diphosphatase